MTLKTTQDMRNETSVLVLITTFVILNVMLVNLLIAQVWMSCSRIYCCAFRIITQVDLKAQTVCGFHNNTDFIWPRCQAPSRESKMRRICHVLGSDGSLQRSTCDQLCPLPLLSKWCCIPDSLHFEAEQMISKAS